MSRKSRLTRRRAQKLGERERSVGLDATDAAARWLDENDPVPEERPPKALGKSKVLHRWRRRQEASRRTGG